MKKYSSFLVKNDYYYKYIYDSEDCIYYLALKEDSHPFLVKTIKTEETYRFSVAIINGKLDFKYSEKIWGVFWTDNELQNIDVWNKVLTYATKYLALK